MKQRIQIKVLKNSGDTTITNYVTVLDLESSATTATQKVALKSSIPNVDSFDVEYDELWLGNNKLKDDEIVKLRSGLEYNLFVK